MRKLILKICVFSFIMSAVCLAGDYAVLMQESPAGAGEIQPGMGVHTFGANEKITLTTVPRNGYKFVYWLGDVSDPTSNRTTLSVDGPKIVIAVFERDAYELPNASAAVCQGPEMLYPHSESIAGGDFSSSPSPEPDDPDYPRTPNSPDTPDNPVPEPGTVALLASGAYMIFRKRLCQKRF